MTAAPQRRVGAAAIVAFLAAVACDSSFEPIAEDERTLSVFGYLDASADTQWIRVGPVRPVVFTTPDPLGVAVTLEEVGSGRTIVLRDSIFGYERTNPELGSEGVYVHNYWTAEPIHPGATYRFRAAGRDGEEATATLPIPQRYDVSVSVHRITGVADELRFDELHIRGVPHIAFVRVIARLRYTLCPGPPLTQVINHVVPTGSTDPHVVPIRKAAGLAVPDCGAPIVERRDLWIVGSGSPWPRGAQFASGALGITDIPSNVDSAIGFVGGVLTTDVPYEDCHFAGDPTPTQRCVLEYDDAKAMASGTIRDSCDRRPLADAVIRFEALDPEPNGMRKVRTAPSGFAGGYRIAGLEPGTRYALNISHPSRTLVGNLLRFVDHVDTLRFVPGERRTLDTTLQRAAVC